MTTEETIGLFEKYVIGNYARLPVVIVRGEGSRVWDADGRAYLDLFPGWGVNALGHCHPAVRDAVRKQAGELFHVANNFYMPSQGELAKVIADRSFGGKTFFCNSGAEANETAIKLARLRGGDGKHEIVTMLDSFHGRTMGAITATGQAKYQEGLGPLVPGFRYVPLNDLDALTAAVTDATCAVMMELVQGEGGVNVAVPSFVKATRDLCDRHGALLVFDEVQTGVGRTGKWFGYQQVGVEPDVITLAKALGGGMPVGAAVAKPDVSTFLKPGTHASTYGGNPMVCAAGLAVFETIEKDGLLENAREQGDYMRSRLREMQATFPFIKDVRGIGLMIGAELDRPGSGIVDRSRARGLLMNCCHDTVLRFLPAMTVTRDEVDEGLDILAKAMAEEA